MHGSKIFLAVPVVLSICGCVSPDAERARALAEAEKNCATEGKQPKVISVQQADADNGFHTTVRYRCLAPGEDQNSAKQ